jgi:hypothetical protein
VKYLTGEGRTSSKSGAYNALKGTTKSHSGHYIRYADADLKDEKNVPTFTKSQSGRSMGNLFVLHS